ncbi:hypothetical protein [Antrihabitans spumae]|uniref:Uncharacterized protein n=1 Tax=Antrihabitans spumae TaxID=3373370 RepID=A0ABW7KX91_9NOCA
MPGCRVSPVAVYGVVDRLLQALLEPVELDRCCAKAVFDPSELTSNPILLGLEKIERYGSCVMGLQESEPFACQSIFLDSQLTIVRVGGRSEALQVIRYDCLDLICKLRVEPDRFVVLFNPFLDQRDQDRALGAVVRLLMSPKANEVRIHRSVAVLGIRHDHPAAAAAAE